LTYHWISDTGTAALPFYARFDGPGGFASSLRRGAFHERRDVGGPERSPPVRHATAGELPVVDKLANPRRAESEHSRGVAHGHNPPFLVLHSKLLEHLQPGILSGK
jgi:hypothetical protein